MLKSDKNIKEDKEERNNEKYPQKQKQYNFTYLDKLIHTGQNKITLEEDVILDINEIDRYTEGICIDANNLVIDGNGHSIDAQEKTRIFRIFGKNITIKNITLKNGYAKNNGGAILNLGETSITDSTLEMNTAKLGGAILNSNKGKLTIKDTIIHKNTAKYGGAILNRKGIITVTNSQIHNNKTERGNEIYNRGKIRVNEETPNTNKETKNKDHKNSPLKENEKNFTYLNQLIHGKTRKIKLENDIKLDVLNKEEEKYPKGITIDVDEVEIDGNGHTIDAQGQTRIFRVTGNKVIIRNVILKNGDAEKEFEQANGGAIYNYRGSLILQNAILKENTSKRYGGAIYNNQGVIMIKESLLEENRSQNYAGAVYNDEGKTTIKYSRIQDNSSGRYGGAIINFSGETTIEDTRIQYNHSLVAGAIINMEGPMRITDVNFIDNNSQKEYTEDIYNYGKLKITKARFNNNIKTILNEKEICVIPQLEEKIRNKGSLKVF